MAISFRMPKGVPREIAKFIKSRSRRTVKAGQQLSYENATLLYDLLAVREKEVARTYSKAYTAAEKARTKGTRTKHLSTIKQTQAETARIREASAQLESQVIKQEPLPPLASRDIVPVRAEGKFSKDHIEPEESAFEWEIGVDYTEEAGYDHKKGRTSDVSFNARLFRRDGVPLTESQIREAMDYFASEGECSFKDGNTRQQVQVKAVNWRDWKGQPPHKIPVAKDLESFQSILMTVGDGGLRAGAVKEDDE